MFLLIMTTIIKGKFFQINMKAKLDGFRVYKIKNRGDNCKSIDRKFIAPVYVMGLPGDVELLNLELEEE